MSKTSKITPLQCSKWLYGPQISVANSKYVVGGPQTGKWREAYDKCSATFQTVYGSGFTPNKIRTYLLSTEDTGVISGLIVAKLNKSASVLDVLLLHSALINTFGIIESQQTTNYATEKANICALIFFLFSAG